MFSRRTGGYTCRRNSPIRWSINLHDFELLMGRSSLTERTGFLGVLRAQIYHKLLDANGCFSLLISIICKWPFLDRGIFRCVYDLATSMNSECCISAKASNLFVYCVKNLLHYLEKTFTMSTNVPCDASKILNYKFVG